MVSFSDKFPSAALMKALGDDVIYTRRQQSFAIKADVERNVERAGNDGFVIEFRTEIELIKADIPFQPQRGDTIKEKTTTFTVDSIIYDDGVFVRLAVR